jgi:hypothetical protein
VGLVLCYYKFMITRILTCAVQCALFVMAYTLIFIAAMVVTPIHG